MFLRVLWASEYVPGDGCWKLSAIAYVAAEGVRHRRVLVRILTLKYAVCGAMV